MESPGLISKELVDDLKRRVTLIKHKSSGKTFSRIFFLTSAEDAIHYDGSRRGITQEACTKKKHLLMLFNYFERWPLVRSFFSSR